jgi:hypothetical protein
MLADDGAGRLVEVEQVLEGGGRSPAGLVVVQDDGHDGGQALGLGLRVEEALPDADEVAEQPRESGLVKPMLLGKRPPRFAARSELFNALAPGLLCVGPHGSRA